MPGLLKDPPSSPPPTSSSPSSSSSSQQQAIVDDLTECVDVQEWLLERYRYLRRELEDVDREVNHLRNQMEQRIQQRERTGYNSLRLSDFSEGSDGSSSDAEIDFGLGLNLRDLLRQRSDTLGLSPTSAELGSYNPGPGILGPAPGILVTSAASMATVQGALATAGAVSSALATAPGALTTASSSLAQGVVAAPVSSFAIAARAPGSFVPLPITIPTSMASASTLQISHNAVASPHVSEDPNDPTRHNTCT